MFKKMIVTKTLLTMIVSVAAHAGCEDAQSIATSSALKAASEKFGVKCSVNEDETKQTVSWPSKKQETWKIAVSCKNQPLRSYSVTLIEKEDAVCFVKRTTLHPLSGAQCGLSDSWGGDNEDRDEWQFDEKRDLAVYKMSPKKLLALDAVSQQQLIITASFATEEVPDAELDVVKAVALLKEASGDEVYLVYFSFKGQNYASTRYYPGDNPVGIIFKDGSAETLAANSDDSISCSEEN